MEESLFSVLISIVSFPSNDGILPRPLRSWSSSVSSISSGLPSHDSRDWFGATVGGTFFTTWSTPSIGNLSKVDRKKAERKTRTTKSRQHEELRCPNCEARPLPLHPSRNVAAHVLTNALALTWWNLRFQPLWTNYTAKTVMKEFKITWVKHCGWPEIIAHDQGPELMGNEFQNPAGAAGVLTMPIDSQSNWQNENQKERDSRSNINCGIWMKSVTSKVGQSLKLQWPSVVTRGTDTAIGGVSQRINACFLVPACVCLEACALHRANEMRTGAWIGTKTSMQEMWRDNNLKGGLQWDLHAWMPSEVLKSKDSQLRNHQLIHDQM